MNKPPTEVREDGVQFKLNSSFEPSDSEADFMESLTRAISEKFRLRFVGIEGNNDSSIIVYKFSDPISEDLGEDIQSFVDNFDFDTRK